MAGSFQGRPFLRQGNVYPDFDVLKPSHDPAMKKIISAIAFVLIMLPAAAQKQRTISAHIEFIQQRTVSDRTIDNNPWGTGLGLQIAYKPHKTISPFVHVSGLVYLGGTGAAHVDENDTYLPDVGHLVNLFAGIAYKPNSTIYFSLAGGPSYTRDQALFGIKPAMGFYFSPAQKWRAQIAYLNVFNRGIEGSEKNFASVAFSIGLKLF